MPQYHDYNYSNFTGVSEQRRGLLKTYTWMFFGLLITAATSYLMYATNLYFRHYPRADAADFDACAIRNRVWIYRSDAQRVKLDDESAVCRFRHHDGNLADIPGNRLPAGNDFRRVF